MLPGAKRTAHTAAVIESLWVVMVTKGLALYIASFLSQINEISAEEALTNQLGN